MWESFVKAEENPKTSLKERDIQEAEKLIENVTDKFITEFKEADKKANDIEESGEKSLEISKVDMIKQSLN